MIPVRPIFPRNTDKRISLMQAEARFIAMSTNQIIWRMGWLKESTIGRAKGFYTEKFTFVRCLYDGRVLETFQHKSNQPPFGDFPLSFRLITVADAQDEQGIAREVEEVRAELVELMLGIINYGMWQHQRALELVFQIVHDRTQRPPSGLENLFGNWKFSS